MRAIVTGGGSGIGAAAAALLRARARVIVIDRSIARATTIRVDVTDAAASTRAVAEAAARLGGLDVVINNAGIGAQGTVEDNDDDEWHQVFDVNVVGMVRVARAALPFLRESSSAAIVNTCSVAATAGIPNRALYSASKGAVMSLTLAMAADHVGEGIRVNCVVPGHGGHAVGRAAARRRRRPRGRARRAGGPPADGTPGQRGRGRGGDRPPGASTRGRPAPPCSSTAGCRGCGCGSS